MQGIYYFFSFQKFCLVNFLANYRKISFDATAGNSYLKTLLKVPVKVCL